MRKGRSRGRYIAAAGLCLLLFSVVTGCGSPVPGINQRSVVESRVAAQYYPIASESSRVIGNPGGSGSAQFSSHLPDLVIESIIPAPENPSKGDIVTLTVTINNTGTTRASTSQINYYVDGSLRLTREIESIQAGDSTTEGFTWIAQYGSHTITMIIDEENWIAENNDANNSRTVTITTLIPDLAIDSVTWSPESPVEGATVTFSVNVTNTGEGNAVSSFIFPYVNNELLDSVSVQPIAAGGSYMATFSYVVQTGDYDIRLTIDPTNVVQEADEDNNVMLFSLLPILPDLIVEDITWSPFDPSVGETIEFSVTIKNQGSAASGSARFHYYIGSFSSGFKAIQEIPPDSSITRNFTWTAIADRQTVKVIVDPNSQVSEGDEDNNEYTTNFGGARAADLYIQSLAWSPAEPAVGETMTVSVTVKNKGRGTADRSLVSFYVDDILLESDTTNALEPDESQGFDFKWTVQDGSHLLKVTADSRDVIDEDNEENNEKVLAYPVPPDLTIDRIVWSPMFSTAGENITFTISVSNRGSITTDDFTIAVNIDNNYAGVVFMEALDPGVTKNGTFVWVADSGIHAFNVSVDPSDKIAETDEANNQRAVSFTVSEAPLTTTENTSEGERPETDEAGEGGGGQGPAINVGNGAVTRGDSNPWLFYLLGFLGLAIVSFILYDSIKRRR